ncbi:MAG: hypothetical protein ACRC2R_21315 [Xenococcaceae cyanobacterium]
MSYLFKNSTFEAFVEEMRSRLHLYFGNSKRKNLTNLWCLLQAYEQAVIEHEIPESEQLDFTLANQFDDWLREKFDMGKEFSWYGIIMIAMNKSEEEGWELFFQLWDEFRGDLKNCR